MDTATTAKIIQQWCESFAKDDLEAVIDGLSETVIFDAPLNQFNKVIPYLGRKVGRQAVVEALAIRSQTVAPLEYKLLDMIFQGNKACLVSQTKEICKQTQQVFELEDIQWLELDEDGKIAAWRFFFDPNPEVAAFKANLEIQLLEAIKTDQLDAVCSLLDVGANPNIRDTKTGLTALMMAARLANVAIVATLLEAGAEIWTLDSCLGTSVLHQACQGGSVEVVQLLIAAGAFVDAVTANSGHSTPLHEALLQGHLDCAEVLLEAGANLWVEDDHGQTALTIARSQLGQDHSLTQQIECRLDQQKGGIR